SIDLEAYRNPPTATHGSNPPAIFRGVRTDRYMYAKYRGGAEELYDLRKDPLELQNAASEPAYARVRASLQRLVGALANCVGVACRRPPALTLSVGGCSAALVPGSGMPQEATFYLAGKRLGHRGRPPIRIGLPHDSHGKELQAVATSLDGRIVSMGRKLRC